MTISYLKGNTASSGSVTSPQTLALNSTKNSCIVAYTAVQNATTLTSITDTLGNSYNQVYLNVAGGGSQFMSVYYCLNSIGGNNTVNINIAANNWAVSTVIQEFFGVAAVSALDTNGHSTSASFAATQSGPAVTTTNNNDVIVAGFFETTTTNFTLGAGYTHLDTVNAGSPGSICMESQVVQTTGTYTPTIATSVSGFTGDTVALVLKAQPGKSVQSNNLRPHTFSPGLSR